MYEWVLARWYSSSQPLFSGNIVCESPSPEKLEKNFAFWGFWSEKVARVVKYEPYVKFLRTEERRGSLRTQSPNAFFSRKGIFTSSLKWCHLHVFPTSPFARYNPILCNTRYHIVSNNSVNWRLVKMLCWGIVFETDRNGIFRLPSAQSPWENAEKTTEETT